MATLKQYISYPSKRYRIFKSRRRLAAAIRRHNRTSKSLQRVLGGIQ